MSKTPSECPQCHSTYIYQDASLWVCPECSYEWTIDGASKEKDLAETERKVVDANGNALQDGDSVSIIKDLKLKGSSSALKVGTKVKNIRVVEGEDGHDISCKIDGFGQIFLKSEFVKKV